MLIQAFALLWWLVIFDEMFRKHVSHVRTYFHVCEREMSLAVMMAALTKDKTTKKGGI
jgi:hypothetical protein